MAVDGCEACGGSVGQCDAKSASHMRSVLIAPHCGARATVGRRGVPTHSCILSLECSRMRSEHVNGEVNSG
eukprot:1618493-Pleurochrysis_carterae.AAC.2